MKKIEISSVEQIFGGQSGNCAGIYHACNNVAALGGAAIVVGTAGWGIVFGVLLAGAGMELCKQQYMGCH